MPALPTRWRDVWVRKPAYPYMRTVPLHSPYFVEVGLGQSIYRRTSVYRRRGSWWGLLKVHPSTYLVIGVGVLVMF